VEVVSSQRRREIIDALRRGTVPQRSLDVFAVGLERFDTVIDETLEAVANQGAVFKAVRGEYGSGKTFFGRFLQERAKRRRFAVAEVQISETETPLHRLETVYRRAMERLSTIDTFQGALRSIIDGWIYGLEEEAIAEGCDESRLVARTDELLEQRLATVSRVTPQFGLAIRRYRHAQVAGDSATAEGLIAWLSGQPHIGAAIKRQAGIKGDVDHFAALSFLQGLLVVLRDSGYAGLVLVLDEIETLQRVRGDVREKGLNALRQLVDEIDAGRFPGLFLIITGTPAFYDGPQGIRRLEPLAQRLHVDFAGDPKFDNLRAVQIRLPGFDPARLVAVGRRVRDLYAQEGDHADRIHRKIDDACIERLASGVTGQLGGRVGVAPRIFLKKLVSELLDRVDQFDNFEPTRDYQLTLADQELNPTERSARAKSVDDIELDDV